MSVYVDTSGFYAYICSDDEYHKSVKEVFHRLVRDQERFVSTSYVLSETMGLVQRRMGFGALETFVKSILPALDIFWIGELEHKLGWQLMKSTTNRHFTIVDATGILVMQRENIRRCVALDPAFSSYGFRVLPEQG